MCRLAPVRPSFGLGGSGFWFCLGGVMCGARRRARARVRLMVATGCSAYLTIAHHDARPARRLPDVELYDDFRPSRWCHGGILQSSGRSEALPSTPTLPGRGPRARQFPISRSERRASSVATPPRALEGQGHAAIRGRPIGGPSGLGQTVGHAPNARHRSSSMAYLRL